MQETDTRNDQARDRKGKAKCQATLRYEDSAIFVKMSNNGQAIGYAWVVLRKIKEDGRSEDGAIASEAKIAQFKLFDGSTVSDFHP